MTLPLRVLYLNAGAKPGGAEFALLRLISGLDRSKVHPIVLFGSDGPAVEILRGAEIETFVLPLSGKVGEVRKDSLGGGALAHPGRLLLVAGYAAKVAAFARKHRIDLIHTNVIKAHIYGAAAGCLAGLPVVWHIRDYVNESYFPKPAVQGVRFLARHAPTHVLAVSRSVMEQLRLGDSGRRSTVVHDGLSDHELPPASAHNDRDGWQPPVRIGIVGRLASWKGQHVFIEAANSLLKKGRDARFLIVGAPLFGEEDYERQLRSRVDELGIASHVEFLGFRRDIPEIMRSLDILVHASTSGDPCPNTVLEGMAEGLPVIGSNGGGLPEMITDGETGLLSPMGDAEGLADAMDRLVSDPALARRLGRAGFKHVRENFTTRRVARQVEAVYAGIGGR